MKKSFFAVLMPLLALTMTLTSCSDKPVVPAQLPAPIQSFVKQTFPEQTISYAQKDLSLMGWKYEVVLNSGTIIEFDTDHQWDKIDCLMASVPLTAVPQPIAGYVTANFPGMIITSIDKESHGYDVDLANGLELKFDKQGALKEVDD